MKHRSPRSIVREFLSTDPGGPDEAVVEPHPADPEQQPRTFVSMTKEITREGRWAFVRIYPRGKAELHWFVDARQSDQRIAHMLGHELGHLSGENLDDDRLEEYRADEYGQAAMKILQIIVRHRKKVPVPRPKAARSARGRPSSSGAYRKPRRPSKR